MCQNWNVEKELLGHSPWHVFLLTDATKLIGRQVWLEVCVCVCVRAPKIPVSYSRPNEQKLDKIREEPIRKKDGLDRLLITLLGLGNTFATLLVIMVMITRMMTLSMKVWNDISGNPSHHLRRRHLVSHLARPLPPTRKGCACTLFYPPFTKHGPPPDISMYVCAWIQMKLVWILEW